MEFRLHKSAKCVDCTLQAAARIGDLYRGAGSERGTAGVVLIFSGLTFCRSPGRVPLVPNSATQRVALKRGAEAPGHRTARGRVLRPSWAAPPFWNRSIGTNRATLRLVSESLH